MKLADTRAIGAPRLDSVSAAQCKQRSPKGNGSFQLRGSTSPGRFLNELARTALLLAVHARN